MILQRFLYLILLSFLLFNCSNEKSTNTENQSSPLGISIDSIVSLTVSNKKFILIEDRSMGNSISTISIVTEGFEIVNDTYEFGELDPIESTFIADLDNNGFEEFYFITRSAGSGSYAKLYGLASNRDKSVSQIYVNENFNGEFFNGFMGHNEYRVEKNLFLNTFPVYESGDPNSAPSGGMRTIEYNLLAGKAGWILKPFSIGE